MGAILIAILGAVGLILAAVVTSVASYFSSRSDRRARLEAEARAEQEQREKEHRAELAEQRRQELEALRVLAQEQRAELERKDRDLDDYRARDEARQGQMDNLRRQLADERRDRRMAEDAWHRLQARHPDE